MELIKDSIASKLLLTLAKQVGFEAEPAAINLANDIEEYTLFVMHMWLIQEKQLYIHISHMSDTGEWSVDVYSTAEKANIDDYCAGLQNNPSELGYHKSYPEALEAGLKYAFHLIIENKVVHARKS
jgi:hypothetical protein